jgi:peptidyl-prolyl cis-trans isomerase B (cyclophilin B)
MRALIAVAVVFFVLALVVPETADCQAPPKVKKVDAKAIKGKDPDSVAVIEIEELVKSKEGEKATPVGYIVLRFFKEAAPKHVANFSKLASRGDYDGTTFHRVIPGFMIQGGDMNSKDNDRSNDGFGSHPDGVSVPAEFTDISHTRGIVSMARSSQPNSAGCQFFICVANVPHLNGQYSVFGEVIEGLDVVDKIVAAKRDNKNNPLNKMMMKKVTMKTFKAYKKGDKKE